MKLKNASLEHFYKNCGAKSQKSSHSSSSNPREPIEEEEPEQEFPSIPSSNTPTTSMPQCGRIYDIDLLPHDPGKRIPISEYHKDDLEAVRRAYILRKTCQPKNHDFPQRDIGGMRRFNVDWFDQYAWFEYSVEKDSAFCFVCYLFNEKIDSRVDAFVNGGFWGWNKYVERFHRHIGGIDSAHKKAQEKYDDFIDPTTSLEHSVSKLTMEMKRLYKCRLTHSIDCLKFLLRQGLSFRGHDESEKSSNRGNFIELLKWLAYNNDEVDKVVMGNAPADESGDVCHKEQLAICLRYVNKKGKICERLLGIIHVEDTSLMTLKQAIEGVLMDHSLSMSRICGQGYDGASNMRGEINGLKTLIMNETPSAYYIHCFAHQLQLTLVAVAKGNDDCNWFFEQIGYLLNVIGSSCKRKEMLRVIQAQKVLEKLELGEIESGQGLNQELGLGRPGDTRWGSHYKTILNVISLYSTIFDVLIMVGKSGHQDDRVKAQTVMVAFESFQFVFMAYLMLTVFGYTDDLCNALQDKEQDIVNAMTLVTLTKDRLQKVREGGWDEFLAKVCSFCAKNDIEVPDMDAFYVAPGRSRHYFEKVTNSHRFRVHIFLSIIDLQLQELNNRFDEVNMELLTCMACLNPNYSFAYFDKPKVIRLAEFYPNEFSDNDLLMLEFQVNHFIDDMRRDARFKEVCDIGELSMMLVDTNKHNSYNLVYKLLKLVLILPVAIASVERVFSGMTYIKNKLRNSMRDQLLNDTLVTFIERDMFLEVSNKKITRRFQAMKNRRMILDEE